MRSKEVDPDYSRFHFEWFTCLFTLFAEGFCWGFLLCDFLGNAHIDSFCTTTLVAVKQGYLAKRGLGEPQEPRCEACQRHCSIDQNKGNWYELIAASNSLKLETNLAFCTPVPVACFVLSFSWTCQTTKWFQTDEMSKTCSGLTEIGISRSSSY